MALSVAGLVAGCGASGPSAQSKTKTFVIGDIQGLSGIAAQIGVWQTQGVQVALDQFNKSGTLPGVKVVQKTEDSQWLPDKALQGYQQLTKVDGVEAVVAGGSAVIHALSPLATQSHTLIINAGAQDPAIAGISPYVFDVNELSNEDAAAMANYAATQLHVKTAALFYVDNATGDIAQFFKQYFEQDGGRIVASETFQQNATSFGTQLSAIAAAKPQAIYIAGTPAEPPFIVKQARQMGITAQFLSYSAVETPQMLQAAGSAANGLIYTATYFDPKSTDPGVQKFVQGYKRKYGQTPQSFYQALGYDAAYVILQALVKDHGQYSGQALRKAILEIPSFDAGVGSFSFHSNGTVQMPVQIKEIKNGAFVPLATGHY